MGRLDGKVAIITGAASGTGVEHAQMFVAEGARVVLTDIADEAGRAVAAILHPPTKLSRTTEADVSRRLSSTQSLHQGSTGDRQSIGQSPGDPLSRAAPLC
jgi:NAD(P)-dependent dehydrogenase (short-subunit alcohol dehydrogenase family)